jgi:serine/threonine-protein kinase
MVGIGSIIGSYKITEKIGEGGMGSVYKGVDQMLEREVAIKMLRPELARQPDVLERFRAEAVTLAKLNHPNIATLYNFLHHEGDYFMVMEFVPGNTVENIILKYGAIAYERAIPLFCQALEGIDQAHRKGIIHRDIKPANIMVLDSGAVKVMDFGIARMLGSARLTKQGNVVGTVEYMSPEAIRGEDVDARSDIYSLGILLYEMLTGRLPFENTSEYELMRSQIEDAPPPPTVYLPNIPVAIEQAIMRSLAKKREARFQTAGEFRAVLLSSLVASTSQLGNTANYAAPATRILDAVPQTGESLKGGTQVVNRNTPPQANIITPPEKPLPPTQLVAPSSPSQEIKPPVMSQETFAMGSNPGAPVTEQGTLILNENQRSSTPLPSNRLAGAPPSTPIPPVQQYAPPAPPTSQQTQRFSGESQVRQPSGTQIVTSPSGTMTPPPALRDSRDQFQPTYAQPMPPAAKKSNMKVFAAVGIVILVLAAAATAFFVSKNRNAATPTQPAETTTAPSEQESTPPQTDNQAVTPPTVETPTNSNTAADEPSANANASTNPNAAKQRSRREEKNANTTGDDTKQAEAPPPPTVPPAPEVKAPQQPETKPAPPKTEQPATTTEPKTAEKPKKRNIFQRMLGIGGDDDKKKKEEEKKKKEEKKNP